MRSSVAGRSRPTAAPGARKLPRIGVHTIEPRGPFTLASAARFIAGWPPGQALATEDRVELNFLVDDWSGPAKVVLTQNGAVHAEVEADNEQRALQQAARVLSLDHDGTGYANIDDPHVRELQEASGYLRPVLFHSPYEAAAWSVISARTQHAQAAKLRDALSVDGTFPAPTQLLELRELQGLPDAKVPRLHGVAEAALAGDLDREALLALEPEDAREQLRRLPGIGPFYANLILLRAVGTTDVLADEPRLMKLVDERYGVPLEQVAERWRPFRTWVSVLIRASA